MGGGSAPKPDTAITLSISKLASLLGIKPTLLRNVLGTNQIELRDQPKIIAGGIDAERDMGFWPFFNQVGQVPIIDSPREMYIHDYRRTCFNGAVNAGNHSVKIEPAADSLLIMYFISVVNRDAAARDAAITFYTAGAARVSILNSKSALAFNSMIVFPPIAAESYIFMATEKFLLTDAFEIEVELSSVAVAEDSRFFMLYSYVGTAPTITETGPAGSTFSDVS